MLVHRAGGYHSSVTARPLQHAPGFSDISEIVLGQGGLEAADLPVTLEAQTRCP